MTCHNWVTMWQRESNKIFENLYLFVVRLAGYVGEKILMYVVGPGNWFNERVERTVTIDVKSFFVEIGWKARSSILFTSQSCSHLVAMMKQEWEWNLLSKSFCVIKLVELFSSSGVRAPLKISNHAWNAQTIQSVWKEHKT